MVQIKSLCSLCVVVNMEWSVGCFSCVWGVYVTCRPELTWPLNSEETHMYLSNWFSSCIINRGQHHRRSKVTDTPTTSPLWPGQSCSCVKCVHVHTDSVRNTRRGLQQGGKVSCGADLRKSQGKDTTSGLHTNAANMTFQSSWCLIFRMCNHWSFQCGSPARK